MTNRISITAISFFIILSLLLSGCSLEPGSELGIYLTDTGELVLCESDISSFDSEHMFLELNKNGIKRWNSFAPTGIAPKLADTLHARDFVFKLEGEELFEGKFWSLASSQMHVGPVIEGSLFEMNEAGNRLFIKYGCPPTMADDPGMLETVKEKLIQHFGKAGLLH